MERALVLMGCAIGAGLALIAGIGPGIGEGTVPPVPVKSSAATPSARATSPAP